MKKMHCIFWGIMIVFMISCISATAGDKSWIEVKPYGFLKLDGAYDQNLTSHGNFVMWVDPAAYDDNDEQFNMTANESRFGFEFNGRNYESVNVDGRLEFDLYANVNGGVNENSPMLMLRHAYFTIQSGNFRLLAGQSWDIISPLNPSTLNYSILWGCGNIGYLRPQISAWLDYQVNENISWTWAAGFFRTFGSDLTPTFSLALGEETDGPDDGTDAGIPSLQALWDWKYSWGSEAYARFGVSGLWGKLKAETNLGHYENYENWATVGHFLVSMPEGWGFSGEFYTGSNLGSYFGGILNDSQIEGTESSGAWASAWFKLAPKIKFTTGFGLDDPKDDDLAPGRRSKNNCYFGNIQYSIVPQVTVGLEISRWETNYLNDDSVDNVRAQTSFIMNF